MPPKGSSSLANMLASDSESEIAAYGDSKQQESAPPAAKKGKRRKAAHKRFSGGRSRSKAATGSKMSSKAKPGRGKAVEESEVDDSMLEQSQTAEEEENAGAEETEQYEEPSKKRRGRPPRNKPSAKALDSKKDQAPEQPVAEPAPKQRGRRKKNPVVAEVEEDDNPEEATEAAPEEQEGNEQVEEEVEEQVEEAQPEPTPPSPRQSRTRKPTLKAQEQPATTTNKRKRAESASEAERGNEKVMKQDLDDLTKRFKTLENRYTKLQEVGIKEANANFDRLKEMSKSQEKAADDLIKSLKADLSAARKEASEVEAASAKLNKAEDKWKESQKTLKSLNEKLSTAQSENKALQAKLAATRQASVEATSNHSRVPGSATKGKGKAVANPVAAAQAAAAQLKEDLYGDLTGLIIRSVEREDEFDVYDCIQTGINGTLHFQLEIDTNNPDASYEEVEFTYVPKLDERRDRDLFDILPDYLTAEEGITFPRSNSSVFYSRISDFLTRKNS